MRVDSWDRCTRSWLQDVTKVTQQRWIDRRSILSAVVAIGRLQMRARLCKIAASYSVEFLNAATADRKHLTANPTGGRGYQEECGRCDVQGFAQASDRGVLEHDLLGLRS